MSPAPVPFVALDRTHAPLREELRAAFDRVVDASAYILGGEVEAFEAEFAAFCGTRHCVGVSSGTSALRLALEAAGIGAGDEVLVPAHTFIASALAVVHAGATPVLCDVDRATGLLDVASAEAAVTERTRAVVAVHLYGQTCDMDAVGALAERHGLTVLEDAAQAHGATWDGRRAGTLGHLAAFSFYPSKNLGALGDGGAVCTDDDELAARVRALRNLGQRTKGEHLLLGANERLDGLQAALLRVKLPHLDAANAARQRAAAALREALGDAVEVVAETPRSPSIHHLFAVRVPDREAFAAALAAEGIGTGTHYTPALDAQPALQGHVRTPVGTPEATAWAAEELSLPMFPELTDDEIARVADACHRAVEVAAR